MPVGMRRVRVVDPDAANTYGKDAHGEVTFYVATPEASANPIVVMDLSVVNLGSTGVGCGNEVAITTDSGYNDEVVYRFSAPMILAASGQWVYWVRRDFNTSVQIQEERDIFTSVNLQVRIDYLVGSDILV